MKFSKFGFTLLATAVALAALVSTAHAVSVSYTVKTEPSFVGDTAFSYFTLTGTGTVQIFDANGPVGAPAARTWSSNTANAGSGFNNNTAKLQGTLVGDLTLGTLTFTGGSTIVGKTYTGTPSPNTTPTGADAYDVGVGLTNMINFSRLNGASIEESVLVRDLAIDLTAGAVSNGSGVGSTTINPLHGRLTSSGNTTSVMATAFGATSVGGRGSDIRGKGSNLANGSAGLVSLTDDTITETVVVPYTLNFNFVFDNGLAGASHRITNIDYVYAGQIVATRILIPEPSSVVLAGLGVVGLGFAALRKRRSA